MPAFLKLMLQVYDEDTDIGTMMEEGMKWADVYGIGPGIGTGPLAEKMLEILLTRGTKPLVIDADGINLLKGREKLLKDYPGGTILTPHLGEFSRLTGISPSEWKKDPGRDHRQICTGVEYCAHMQGCQNGHRARKRQDLS